MSTLCQVGSQNRLNLHPRSYIMTPICYFPTRGSFKNYVGQGEVGRWSKNSYLFRLKNVHVVLGRYIVKTGQTYVHVVIE